MLNVVDLVECQVCSQRSDPFRRRAKSRCLCTNDRNRRAVPRPRSRMGRSAGRFLDERASRFPPPGRRCERSRRCGEATGALQTTQRGDHPGRDRPTADARWSEARTGEPVPAGAESDGALGPRPGRRSRAHARAPRASRGQALLAGSGHGRLPFRATARMRECGEMSGGVAVARDRFAGVHDAHLGCQRESGGERGGVRGGWLVIS
jgi:hypothetical protein